MYFLTFTCLTTFHCAPNPAGTPGGSFGVPSVGQFSKVLVVHFWQLPNATRGAPLVIVKVRWLIGEPWYTLSTLPIANTSRQSSPLLKWAAWSICCYLPKEGICYLIYQKVVQLAGQTNHKRVPHLPPLFPSCSRLPVRSPAKDVGDVGEVTKYAVCRDFDAQLKVVLVGKAYEEYEIVLNPPYCRWSLWWKTTLLL